MDLIDALASNTVAGTVVELSLSPQFRRGHGSVMAAIKGLFRPSSRATAARERAALEAKLRRPVAKVLPRPVGGRPWMIAVDALPVARPHARTLEDRGYVHQAPAVAGGAPVTIGHAYSLAVVLPERGRGEPVWTVPLSAHRIATDTTARAEAVSQIEALITDPTLPWHGELVVTLADSDYSQAGFLVPLAKHADLVIVSRLRKDRVCYRRPPPRQPGQNGRPPKYGKSFTPGTVASFATADATELLTSVVGARSVHVKLHRWSNVLLKGEHLGRLAVSQVDVVSCAITDEQGQYLYNDDLLLVIAGDRRAEIGTADAFHAYRRRFDQEHTHRFLRGHLMLDAFQTPIVTHEENWITLVILACQLLAVVRPLAQDLPRPWERKAVVDPQRPTLLGPSRVQRDLPRVLALAGTPALSPKPRGKSPGWPAGTPRARRQRIPVVRRGPPRPKEGADAA